MTPVLRTVAVLLGIGALVVLGRPVLVPLALAMVIAMLLTPLLHRLRERGVGERLAIAACALILVMVVAAIAGLIVLQAAQVARDWPEISQSLSDLMARGQSLLSDRLGVPADTVQGRIRQAGADAGRLAGRFFGTAAGALGLGFLTFVLVIVMLAERERLAEVATRLAPGRRRRDVHAAIDEMIDVCCRYFVGKLKVMSLMAIVYLVAFLIGGVRYAFFLALLIALSSFVPYVGNLIGGAMAVVLAYVSTGGGGALVVLAVLGLAQVIENYVLEPLVVGSQVDLNPFATIAAVFVLGTAWGVAGAVIALPIAGIAKVVCERVADAEAGALLLGDGPVPA